MAILVGGHCDIFSLSVPLPELEAVGRCGKFIAVSIATSRRFLLKFSPAVCSVQTTGNLWQGMAAACLDTLVVGPPVGKQYSSIRREGAIQVTYGKEEV
jgi:hypothetical protein